jgi:hypothetical protein
MQELLESSVREGWCVLERLHRDGDGCHKRRTNSHNMCKPKLISSFIRIYVYMQVCIAILPSCANVHAPDKAVSCAHQYVKPINELRTLMPMAKLIP